MPRTALTWPWPPSIRIRSGQAGSASSLSSPVSVASLSPRLGMPCSLISREKRRSITSRIMPKSSPGVMSVERMLNFRYWFFTNPPGPATIIAPTAFVPMMCELS